MEDTREEQNSSFSRKDVTAEFRKFFIKELMEIYGAEKALVAALPNLHKNAFSPQLSQAIQEHLLETKVHVFRIEKIFELLGEEADFNTCLAMVGLIEEAGDVISDNDEDLIRDAGIILAGQKIEHYEIASYGTMVSFAKTMGENEVAELLALTLADEKKADKRLTDLAENFVNQQAITETNTLPEIEHSYSGYVSEWMPGNF